MTKRTSGGAATAHIRHSHENGNLEKNKLDKGRLASLRVPLLLCSVAARTYPADLRRPPAQRTGAYSNCETLVLLFACVLFFVGWDW
jgi:hypothetical protein